MIDNPVQILIKEILTLYQTGNTNCEEQAFGPIQNIPKTSTLRNQLTLTNPGFKQPMTLIYTFGLQD